MPIKKLFDGSTHYPTDDEMSRVDAQLKREEDDLRCPDDRYPEILYLPATRAAWKALSRDERIKVLDMLVAENAIDNESLIALFPKLVTLGDIADFTKLGSNAANFRDCTLQWAFDPEKNEFTAESYRRSLANFGDKARDLAEFIGQK